MLKKSTIATVFNELAPRYDGINRLLSGYQDVLWRRKLARTVCNKTPDLVVDLATGTADIFLYLAQHNIQFKKGIGLDPAQKMLAIGQEKLDRNHLDNVTLLTGVATDIPLPDASVDLITMSFGIRNVDDYEAGLAEMTRVLKPESEALILEFSLPPQPLRSVYLLYLRHILPKLGRLVSGHPTAYTYLNQTIETFPYGNDFATKLYQAGFKSVQYNPLSCGVVTVYHAKT